MEYSEITEDKLIQFTDLLLKWNKKINLISKNTEKDIWERHIADSLQLTKLIDADDFICDLGSGGGFPGIILSLSGCSEVVLVESDLRKCIFLKEASKLSDAKVLVVNSRIEDVNFRELTCDVITSRALAELKVMLDYFVLINPRKKMLLLKGAGYKKELEEAEIKWQFDCKIHKSLTNNNSAILEITNAQRK